MSEPSGPGSSLAPDPPVYFVRQSHPSTSSRRVTSWGSPALQPEFYDKYGRFQNTLANALQQNSDLSLVDALLKTEEAFLGFFSRAGVYMDERLYLKDIHSRDLDDAFIDNIPSSPSADPNELQTIFALGHGLINA